MKFSYIQINDLKNYIILIILFIINLFFQSLKIVDNHILIFKFFYKFQIIFWRSLITKNYIYIEKKFVIKDSESLL